MKNIPRMILLPCLALSTGLPAISLSAAVIPYEESGRAVADYQDDFQGPTVTAGWSYTWNAPLGWAPGASSGSGSSNPVGTAAQYLALLWNGTNWNPDGDTTYGNNQPAGYLRCAGNGGHPGLGSTQTGNVGNTIDRCAISGFTVTESGTYQVTGSQLSKGTAGATGLDLNVFVNDTEIPERGLAYNGTGNTNFDGPLGSVTAGQTVYISVGPAGSASSDSYNLDYTLRLEPSYDLSGDQSESDTDIFLVGEQAVLLEDPLTIDRALEGGETLGPEEVAVPHIIPAGTLVTSRLLHFDPVTGGTVSASITFDQPVYGLIFNTTRLDATDGLLGSAAFRYPSEGGITLNRGALSEVVDTVTVSADRKMLNLTLQAGEEGRVDQIRILFTHSVTREGLVFNPSGEINSGVDRDPISHGSLIGWDSTGGQIIKGNTFADNGRWRMSIEDSNELYQLTDHIITAGEAFSLRFDARAFSGLPDSVVATLFVEDTPPGRIPVATRTFAFDPPANNDWQGFQLLTDFGDLDTWAGWPLGISFSGTDTGAGKYLSIDQVSLVNLPAPSPGVRCRSGWTNAVDRTWAGPAFWSNRLQDWQVVDQRLACIRQNLPMRTTHLTTCRLDQQPQDFSLSVRTGLHLGGTDNSSFAGLLIGAGSRLGGRGASLVFHQDGQDGGILAGLGGQGRAEFRDMATGGYPVLASDGSTTSWAGDADLTLTGTFDGATYDLELTARRVSNSTLLGQVTLSDVEPARLLGNIALVSHEGSSGDAAFWFQHFVAEGAKLTQNLNDRVGPVLSMQHTLSEGTLNLCVQLMPVEVGAEIAQVTLQVYTNGTWDSVSSAPIDEASYTALFRLPGWNDREDIPYRVLAGLEGRDGTTETFSREGTIRKDPADKPIITVAGFTGNLNIANGFRGLTNPSSAPVDWTPEFIAFPHEEVTRHVALQDPDLLFFSGDQVYEGGSPSPRDTGNLKLDYLYKWYLWCWAYRDLAADIPTVCVPDDHDVFQGNLWGQGGRAAGSQTDGGYVHPAWFVKAVEATQTSSLPLPPDPADDVPVDQGIGVYYTRIKLGGIGLGVIEDRKFKIGSTSAEGTDGDPATDVMLGTRQLNFLEAWGRDWTNECMKAVMSQTVFAMTTTHASEGLNYRTTDKDSNGWPPTARDRAVDVIRRAFIFMIGGDQHLATVVHHGIDTWGDAGISFCVPSVINAFPRVWDPANPTSGATDTVRPYLGDYQDGFGNYMTFHAVANPASYYSGLTSSGMAPARIHDRAPGYGIVRFDKRDRSIRTECWPRYANPENDTTGGVYPDWPVTVYQHHNYGRAPYGWLPAVSQPGWDRLVVEVIDEADEQVVYTLCAAGSRFRPHVFADGAYTVRLHNPDTGAWITLEGQSPVTTLPHAIGSFTAEPVYIPSNTVLALAWDVTGSTGLSVDQGVGPVDAATMNGVGMALAQPLADTVYTLTSEGPGGPLQAQVSVRVFETMEAWRTRYFSPEELADPSISGDGADPDGDGLINLFEYALTTDPRGPSRDDLPVMGIASFPHQSDAAHFMTFTYQGLIAVDDVHYTVEVSHDMHTWHPLSGFQQVPVSVTDGGPGRTDRIEARDIQPFEVYPQANMMFRLVLQGS